MPGMCYVRICPVVGNERVLCQGAPGSQKRGIIEKWGTNSTPFLR